ncbi:MAG: hypothetical protein ACN6OP_18895 [Pseudomonadales bacterium]
MGKKSAADIVGANLNRLMAEAGLSNVTLESRLSRHVTKSTIGRMRNAESSAGIGNIEQVARAFGLEAWQLLIPDVSTTNKPRLAGTAPAANTQSPSPAAAELLDLFNQLDDTYRSLLLADAKKYLHVQQPAIKSTAAKKANAS